MLECVKLLGECWFAPKVSTESTTVAVAMDDVSSKLLYADDLVLMAPTMDQVGRRVAKWRASLLTRY